MAKIRRAERQVKLPGKIGVIQPRGEMADAAVWGKAANTADQVGEFFYKVAAQDAARRGKEAANAFLFDKDPVTGLVVSPQRPNIDGQLVPSIYDQAYYEQINTRHQQELVINSESAAHKFALENKHDKAGFDTAWQTYKDKVVQGVPEDIKGSVDTALSKMGVPYGNRIAKEQAEIQAQLSKNTAIDSFNATLANAQQVIAGGGSDEEVEAALGVLDKAVMATTALDPVEKYEYSKHTERQLAFSDISRQIFRGGKPGDPASRANHIKITDQILKGTLPVNVRGKTLKISDLLDGDERKFVAGQFADYSSRYEQLRNKNTQATIEFLDRTILLDMKDQAYRHGTQPNQEYLASLAYKYRNNPDVQAHLINSSISVGGVADKYDRTIAAQYGIGDAIKQMQGYLKNNPEERAWLESESQLNNDALNQLEVAKVLASEGNITGAQAVLQSITDRTSGIPSMSETQKSYVGKLDDYFTRQAQSEDACRTTSGSDEAYQRCLAKTVSIPNFTKKEQGLYESGVEAEATGGAPVNWSSPDENDVKAQSHVAGQYARTGVFGERFIGHLQDTLNSLAGGNQLDTTVAENALSLYNIARSTRQGRMKLDAALGTEHADAYAHLDLNAPYQGFDGQKLREDLNAYLDPTIPNPGPSEQQSKMVSSIMGGGELAEDLSSEAKSFLYGETDNWLWSDELPASNELKAVYRQNIENLARSHSGDIEEWGDLALERTLRNATQTTRGTGTGRHEMLSRTGWIRNIFGTEQAPKQYVDSYFAPEAQFNWQDPRNPNLVMTVFDKLAENALMEIDPTIDWKMGVNYSMQRVDGVSSISGGPVFRLVGTNAQSEPILMNSANAVIDFTPVYEQIQDGTLENMEQWRARAIVLELVAKDPKTITREDQATLKEQMSRLERPFIPAGIFKSGVTDRLIDRREVDAVIDAIDFSQFPQAQ